MDKDPLNDGFLINESNLLHEKELSKKKELSEERHELSTLMSSLPKTPPEKGSREYEAYERILKQIENLKGKVSKKHDELMDILKEEEKISKELSQKNKDRDPG